ncbi:MAG: YhdT family protein [Synergistales bacterium]|nr:YhdT family protein [Synergistales bacterium]
MKRSRGGKGRFFVAKREAAFSLVLAIAYFFWWYLTGYSFGSGPVRGYSYIMGLPAWFFLSCVAGFFIFSILAFLMVRFFFTDIPLAEKERNEVSSDD